MGQRISKERILTIYCYWIVQVFQTNVIDS